MQKKTWDDFTSGQKLAMTGAAATQVTLLISALIDIRRRPAAEIHGSKRMWTLLSFVNFVGPVSYFLFGRKR